MDFHHRKLLLSEKINSYNNNSNSSEPLEEKNKFDNCDDCKDVLDDYYLPTPLPPPPPPTHHSSSILILMLCILGVAFVLVSYFSIVRYRSRSLRRSNSLATTNGVPEDFIDENHGPVVDHPIWYIRTIGLQQSVIDSIMVFKYRKDEKLVEGSDCSVCLSEFQEDENLRLLPKCNHAFHIHCIDTWLRSHQNCPLCRASVVGEVNLNGGLGSVEEGEGERVENGGEVENREGDEENATNEMRVRGEHVISLPNDEENDERRSRKDKVRVRSDFVEYNVKLDEEIEKVRRSISLNTYSASMAYLNLIVADKIPVDGEGSSNSKDEGCSNVQTTERMKQSSEIISRTGSRNPSIYRLMKSSSLGRSLQKMPISMKRSFSSAGKSSLSTHSRSQRSTETLMSTLK